MYGEGCAEGEGGGECCSLTLGGSGVGLAPWSWLLLCLVTSWGQLWGEGIKGKAWTKWAAVRSEQPTRRSRGRALARKESGLGRGSKVYSTAPKSALLDFPPTPHSVPCSVPIFWGHRMHPLGNALPSVGRAFRHSVGLSEHPWQLRGQPCHLDVSKDPELLARC